MSIFQREWFYDALAFALVGALAFAVWCLS